MHWLDNHALAEAECRLGWAHEDLVATHLRGAGLDVDTPPKSWRADVSERHAYANELDLIVQGLRVSVKSRRVEFTTPDDIPANRNPLFVDTMRKWDQRTPEPVAVVCVSQVTKAMIWTPASRRWQWSVKHAYDNVRGFAQDFWVADRSLWEPIDTLIGWLGPLWDGRWRWPRGVLGVRANRIVRDGTDAGLLYMVGIPFHELVSCVTVKPQRVDS